MHDGPVGMRLLEHQHSKIQVGMQFVSLQKSRKLRMTNDIPMYFSFIPSGKPHAGQWRDGTEAVIALPSRAKVERAADELLRRSSSAIVSAPCAVDPVILSIGSTLRGAFLSGSVIDQFFAEAVGAVLTECWVRRWSSQPCQRRIVEAPHDPDRNHRRCGFKPCRARQPPPRSACRGFPSKTACPPRNKEPRRP